MDNQVQMSQSLTGADAAMTGVMNAMGQDGNYAASRLPIKNRINALDVSILQKQEDLNHISQHIH